MKAYKFGAMVARTVLLGFVVAAGACSSEPETPIAGEYSSQIAQIDFNTTATADAAFAGTKPFSGDVYGATWKRKGDKLTLTSRPNFKGKYQNTYHFDIIDDGARLALTKIETLTEATGETEITEVPAEAAEGLTLNKHI
ncbi:hypothetical protein [Luteimonas sp. MC1750]|uniref:hypothetical protein n=1 Tax=Luteimonas sp. MC1750 TaxID=2799326 RepID=UPI0018F0DE77|nr:hypothetical protein [Luteimonas sp. MC1750]MBJ6984046.1 hypothetical protein [Luteimonas sp. MC1750]QQO06858.1 hypothetical protein JGR68_05370 [Luteimonas sp. MC1750]